MLQRRIDPALSPRLDPEDILGEAYLRARARWIHCEGSADGCPSYSWLYRIALDCLYDAWRGANAARRSIRREVRWPDQSSAQFGLGLIGSATSPSEALAQKERKRRIRSAVDQLKPDDREIITMRHFDGLSHHEAASILNISDAAAMQRYTRALERLRELWERIEASADRL